MVCFPFSLFSRFFLSAYFHLFTLLFFRLSVSTAFTDVAILFFHLFHFPPDSLQVLSLLSGKYRGAAHSACNLLLKIDPRQHTTPVVFHNLRGYDSHFLVANLGASAYKEHYVGRNGHPQVKTVGGVSVIASNMEKFVSLTWNRFRFIDSCQFLSASLDRLVTATPDDAFILSSTLVNHRLLKRKGKRPFLEFVVFFFTDMHDSSL